MSGQTQRRVKRPKKVRVGYLTYTILYMSNDEWERTNQHPGWGGMCSHEEAEIRIRDLAGRHEDTIRETLLHELLHCVWVHTGLNNNHQFSKTEPEDLEEMVVNTMSPSVLMVINDNPAVLAYILNLGQPG